MFDDSAWRRMVQTELERLRARPQGSFITGASLPIGGAVLLTATMVTVQTSHRAINLPDAAITAAFWSFVLPPGWAGKTLTVKALWAPSTTNTGNALLAASIFRQAVGVTLSSVATASSGGLQVPNGVADRPQLFTVSVSLAAFSEGEALSLALVRLGTDGTDTFTGAAQILNVQLSIIG